MKNPILSCGEIVDGTEEKLRRELDAAKKAFHDAAASWQEATHELAEARADVVRIVGDADRVLTEARAEVARLRVALECGIQAAKEEKDGVAALVVDVARLRGYLTDMIELATDCGDVHGDFDDEIESRIAAARAALEGK